jgi:hypothetical protein
LTTAPAQAKTLASAACGKQSYSYAGISAIHSRSGISAGITAVKAPKVIAGHVAAWVGVGGAGLGPGGSTEWLQAGISALPGANPTLYFELAQPGQAPTYTVLPIAVSIGATYQVAVLESRKHAGWWRVWVNGKRATDRFYLPGSHNAWNPVATSESWDGDEGACNDFTFKFSDIRSTTSGRPGWSPMASTEIDAPGYKVSAASPAGFLALGGV